MSINTGHGFEEMDLLFSHENVSSRHVTNAETMCHIICPALLVSRYYTSLYFSFLIEVPVISTPIHRSMHQVLWMWHRKILTAAINQANCKPEGSCLTKTKGALLAIRSLLLCMGGRDVDFNSLSEDDVSEEVVHVVSCYDNHHFPDWEQRYHSKCNILYRSCCICIYASCNGFISFEEGGLSWWSVQAHL